MKVYNLRCQHAHAFEGWFSSEQDFHSQSQAGLLVCPVCGDNSVARTPSAPRVQISRGKPGQTAPAIAQQASLAEVWREVVRAVIENTEDVGTAFAEEARRIHYREAPERAIRGTATKQERTALAEEGIDVVALPALPSLADTLH